MFPDSLKKEDLLPVLIGSGLSIFFIRSGFFSFFFLVPLGFVAFRYEYRTAWNTLILIVLGNALLVLGTAAARGIPLTRTIWDLLFISAYIFIFAWIIVPL